MTRERTRARGIQRVSMLSRRLEAPLADRRIAKKNEHNGIIFHGCGSRSTLAGPIEQDRRIDLAYVHGVTESRLR